MSAPTFVQAAHGHVEGGTTVTCTFSGANLLHDGLLVCVGFYDPTGSVVNGTTFSISDLAGNDWETVRISHIPNSSNLAYAFFSCTDAKAYGTGNIVTIVAGSSGNLLASCEEWTPPTGFQFTDVGQAQTNQFEFNSTYAISGGGVGHFGGAVGKVVNFALYLTRQDQLTPTLANPSVGYVLHDSVVNGSAGIGFLGVWSLTLDNTNPPLGTAIDFNTAVSNPVAMLTDGMTFSCQSPAANKPVENPHAYYIQGNGVVLYTGIYPLPIAVTLTQGQANVVMYYTTDGSTPTTSSTLYSGSISISSTTTLKVLVHDTTSFYPDAVFSYQYTIQSAPNDGTNTLCLETIDDSVTLPEPSMNLAIQQLDNVLNGAFTYVVLDQTARQIINGFAPEVSQNLVLILTGALTHDVLICFNDPNGTPLNNQTDDTHPLGHNPDKNFAGTRPFVVINNTTGGHSITFEGDAGVTPTYIMSGTGPKFLYMGGLFGILEIV